MRRSVNIPQNRRNGKRKLDLDLLENSTMLDELKDMSIMEQTLKLGEMEPHKRRMIIDQELRKSANLHKVEHQSSEMQNFVNSKLNEGVMTTYTRFVTNPSPKSPKNVIKKTLAKQR